MAKQTKAPAISGTEHAAVRGFVWRLQQIIGTRSVHRFARECGFSDSLMRKYLNGSYPGLDRLVRLAEAGNVSVEWLATGREPGHTAAPRVSGKVDKHYSASDYTRIPWHPDATGAHYGALSPGPVLPIFHHEWLTREGLEASHLLCLTTTGDAMSPSMREGDLLLIDTSQNTVPHDGIYVLRTGKDLGVRRLQFDLEGGLRVCCDNPDLKDEQLSREAAKQLDIVGRVVWLGKRIK